MKAKELFVQTLLFASLMGCVPALVEYYRPEGLGGRTVSTACGAINPPKINWLYEMGNVTLGTAVDDNTTGRPPGGPGEFLLSFYVPVGTEVRLQNKEVLLRATATGQSQKLELMSLKPIKGTFKWERKKLESTVFKGSGKTEWGLYEGRELFSFSAEIETPIAPEILITLPTINIDGKIFEVPEIRFVKEKKFGIFSINC